jgi:hypothetical protein
LPPRAHAQFTGNIAATGRFESNSNLFDLPPGTAPPANGANGTSRSDTDYAYGATGAARYKFGRQQLYATATVTDVTYQHDTELNHTDYNFDGGWDWKLGRALDGKLDVSRTRAMVPFQNLSGTVLALTVATTQTESAQIGYRFHSDWRLEGTASTSRTDQPIPQEPNLTSTQTSGTATLNYLGVAGFTSGVMAGYLTGNYTGSNSTLNTTYHQETAGLVANYQLSGRSTFAGQLGYTRRQSANAFDDTSGLTCRLDFREQLTPKTSFGARIGRTINSYSPTIGSEIDTEAGLDVNWKPTYKLGVSVGYTFTYRDYPPQGGYAPGNNRVDYQQGATLSINYQARRWLSISPYANYQTRDSNVRDGEFNSTIFGVYVTATLIQR